MEDLNEGFLIMNKSRLSCKVWPMLSLSLNLTHTLSPPCEGRRRGGVCYKMGVL